MEGLEPQFYWNPCHCNELDALLRRHYPAPRSKDLGPIRRQLDILATKFQPFDSVDYNTLIKHTRAGIRRRYRNARIRLINKNTEITAVLTKLKAFVKYEKIPIGKFETGKAPRLIQYRSFEYLYLLKKMLLGFDIQLKNLSDDVRWYHQPLRSVYTKLGNQKDTAQSLRESWDSYANPVAYCFDHRSYDGSIEEDTLLEEHRFWLKLSKSELLKMLLKAQLECHGMTSSGLRFKGKAKRASGEFTTSNGNSNINIAAITSWCLASKLDSFRIHVNGDDSVVIFDASEMRKAVGVDYFMNFGLETEMEEPVFDFRKISYCQANPIRVCGQWTMIKEPFRALSRMCFCDDAHRHHMQRFRLTNGICDLAIYSGVPMLQQFALYEIDRGFKQRPLGSIDKYPAVLSGNEVGTSPITRECREDFYEAFGITEDYQAWFELQLAGKITNPQFVKETITKYKRFHLN